jgi:flagellin
LQGHVVTSTDGANWSPQTVGTNRHLHDIIYANNNFVAVGALHNDSGVHSLALTSADGLRGPSNRLILVRGNRSPTAMERSSSSVTTIDTSTDGVTWTRQTPSVYVSFQAVAFGNGQFVYHGHVQRSAAATFTIVCNVRPTV